MAAELSLKHDLRPHVDMTLQAHGTDSLELQPRMKICGRMELLEDEDVHRDRVITIHEMRMYKIGSGIDYS
jgi:hypothetical protein